MKVAPIDALRPVPLHPGGGGIVPRGRIDRQRRQPCARILATLVIVRGGGQHRLRHIARAILHQLMKGRDVDADRREVGTHLIARQ